MQESLIPILFAMITALCFGAQVVMAVRSFAYVEPQTSSMISIGTCVAIFWFLSPFLLKAEYFTNPGILLFFANGLIHPLFSSYLAFEASKRMGPTVSATISAISPFFATIGAVLILGESITLIFLIGTICTVAGIMTLSWKRQSQINWALPVLVFPLGAAAIRGANQNLGKFALKLLPSPYFASLVSFTVSFVGAIIIYRYRTGSLPFQLPLQSFIWCGLSGICLAVGILSMYSALNYGLVVVVSPIIATVPFFTLLISLLFHQERFSLRVLIGMVLVVGGIIWISIQ